MKKIIIILVTFIITMVTSLLFDWSFVSNNTIRYILVLLLIIFEIVFGMFVLKEEIFKINK